MGKRGRLRDEEKGLEIIKSEGGRKGKEGEEERRVEVDCKLD